MQGGLSGIFTSGLQVQRWSHTTEGHLYFSESYACIVFIFGGDAASKGASCDLAPSDFAVSTVESGDCLTCIDRQQKHFSKSKLVPPQALRSSEPSPAPFSSDCPSWPEEGQHVSDFLLAVKRSLYRRFARVAASMSCSKHKQSGGYLENNLKTLLSKRCRAGPVLAKARQLAKSLRRWCSRLLCEKVTALLAQVLHLPERSATDLSPFFSWSCTCLLDFHLSSFVKASTIKATAHYQRLSSFGA